MKAVLLWVHQGEFLSRAYIYTSLINEGCVIVGTERKELTRLNVVCLDVICVMHFRKSTFREEENWWCLALYVV